MSTTRHRSSPSAVADSGRGEGAPRVHVVTFGCQMNRYDSELVEGRFQRGGYAVTDSMDDADVILFNTCSVRDHAEERAWSWVGELKRVKERRPDLVVGVMGCMAQRVEEEVFRRAGHVDLVAGTRRFHRLPELVDEVRARRADPTTRAADARVLATDTAGDVEVDRGGETWRGGLHAYLAVMRGCDLNCTFCIVPTTRGRVRSRPIDEIEREARWLVDSGVRVITLLGQTINSYGEDSPRPGPGEPRLRGRQGRPSLADVLHRLQGIDGLERVRLITLHPSYVTESFAAAVRDCDKLDRFLPLPVQSGSDEVLRRMKRGYTLDLYRRRVEILRAAVPDIELGSDWIVGFSGETDADFEASEELLEEQAFVVNYVFKYDPRPGTRADDRLPDDVHTEVKKERNARLLALSERVQRRRMSGWIGDRVRVFVESVSERDERVLLGRTTHGAPISFPGPAARVGGWAEVNVEGATAFGLAGQTST